MSDPDIEGGAGTGRGWPRVALMLGGKHASGAEFLPRINEILRARRGTDCGVIRDCVIRPSEDLGQLFLP